MASYVNNKYLSEMDSDRLFHLNLGTNTHDLKMFADVKFICIGGSPVRMTSFAQYLREALSDIIQADEHLVNLTGAFDRYVLYKVGPILVASHGIGVPSMSVCMHELFKLMYRAGASDVTMFRLGTSGGLGLEAGTVVVTSEAVNPEGKAIFEQFICGEKRTRETKLDAGLQSEILSLSTHENDEFKIVSGKTMCADDFYEAQGRIDGALCDYTLDDKLKFLNRLHKQGVRNIEMECTAFSALTSAVGMRSAIVCVTLLNRLLNDQIAASGDKLKEIEQRPVLVISRFIRSCLSNKTT